MFSLVEVSALGAGSGGWIWGQGSHFPVRVRDVLLITLSRLQRGGREAGGRQLSTAWARPLGVAFSSDSQALSLPYDFLSCGSFLQLILS